VLPKPINLTGLVAFVDVLVPKAEKSKRRERWLLEIKLFRV
jgi:hypothetical protein